MKVKNTYSRKKRGKSGGNSKINVFNVNYYSYKFVTVNITNNSSTQGKPESSKSESSDLFDKLVKGPTYNVNNQSTFGSSECSRKFFSQRQDTATFYKSDAEFSISTEISNHLFKDSRDSDIYTPTWLSPPEYCKIKNKLVKIKKEQKITVDTRRIKPTIMQNEKKTYNRIQKKRIGAKPKKVLKKVKLPCISSTPNRSDAMSNKDTWPETHVSPIMPPQYTPSSEYMNATGQNQKVVNQNPMFGVSALIEGLGNLGIETPHCKRVLDKVNSANQEPELFDYQSPLSVCVHREKVVGMVSSVNQEPELFDCMSPLSICVHREKVVGMVNSVNQEPELFDCKSPLSLPENHQSEELHSDNSQQSVTYTPCKKFEEENSGVLNLLLVDNMNSSQILTDVNSCKSGEEIEPSGVSTPQQKRFEEEENLEGSESGQLSCKSPSPGLMNITSHDVSECSALSSPFTKLPLWVLSRLYTEHSLVSNDEKCSSSNISSPIQEKEISNEYTEKNNSRNSTFNSYEEINSDSSLKLKSNNIKTENFEKYNNISDFNCSLPSSRDKNNQYHPEEINECNNSKFKGRDKKSDMYKGDPDDSCLNDSKHQEIPVKELKIKIEGEGRKLQTYQKYDEVSGLIDSNCKLSPTKESKACKTQPLSDLTNLVLDTFNCENTREINKRSISLRKRTAQYSMKDKLSHQPLATELNETLVEVNLEAGKKWRRSLLRQKQPEAKFEKRATMSADTLVKLIKESSILSGLTNDTKVSYNNTTRIIDSLLEDQGARNSSLPVQGGSPEFNFTFSKLSKVHTRKRRIYIRDMNEIPEENSDHSTSRCNETQLCKEDSVLEKEQGSAEECESVSNTTVNQTDIYETPPILKMNPEALSAITDRKQSRRYLARSLGECSMFSDVCEQNEASDEENNWFTSCCSKLDLEDDLENVDDQNIELMGKVGFLLRCGQQGPIGFTEAFPERVLSSGQKIGEGVFGEVFMLERPGEGMSVIKIIPVEGSQLVNGAVQKRFDEVLSELIITEMLSMLRQNNLNCTSGFCELKNKFYLQGQYPSQLLRMWHEFNVKKSSDNECPDMFGPDQLYLALELAHAGEPIESFRFRSPQQALAVFLQTTFSLAVAESAVDFEHRDLHIGNVLVHTTSEKYTNFVLNGTRFECPTSGTMATIIDYTLSRISFKGDVLYLDLEKDPELFTAKGDYQFDIYRHMRADLNNNWRDHQPKTNVRWLHYLIDKLSDKIKYKQKKNTKVYKEHMEKLVHLREIILDFYSATDLAQHLIDSYSQTVSLIRK